MEKWYFTFGIGQILHDYVIVIEGDYRVARSKMIEQFGRDWCAQYNEDAGKKLVDKYGYKIIEV